MNRATARVRFSDLWDRGARSNFGARGERVPEFGTPHVGQVRLRADGGGPVDLAVVAADPAVDSVIATGTDLHVTGDLPQLGEVYASRFATDSLAHLPNLSTLALRGVGGVPGSGTIDLTPCADTLVDLALTARDPRALSVLPKLQRLKTGWCPTCEPLAELQQLRWLSVTSGGGTTALARLENLERLELALENTSVASLARFGGWSHLRRLHVDGRGLKSISGIAELRMLERLSLTSPGIKTLAPLASHARLEDLRVTDFLPDCDLQAVGELPSLRSLQLDLVAPTTIGEIASIGFLRGARSLEYLRLGGVSIGDGDLSPLLELPLLRMVTLHGDFGDQVRELRKELGGAVIVHSPREPIVAETPAGIVRYRRVGESWAILQDFTAALGVESNHEVREQLEAVVNAAAPGLADRVTIDADGGHLMVTSATERDLLVVAAFLNAAHGAVIADLPPVDAELG